MEQKPNQPTDLSNGNVNQENQDQASAPNGEQPFAQQVPHQREVGVADPGHYQAIGNAIGSGAYGQVFKGENTITGECVALKKINITEFKEGVPSTAMREIAILTEVEDKNVVELKEVVLTDQLFFLVQEFCNMDLRAFLQMQPEGGYLAADTIKSLMYQTLSGIQACHMRRIVHRDLKPANILLTGPKNDIVKIADFGLARAFSIPIKPYTKDVVTLWYRAPELLLKIDEYATPIDIWAAGCIFAELAIKDSLFKGRNEQHQVNEIFRIMGLPSEQTWQGITQNHEFNLVRWPVYEKQNFRQYISANVIDDAGLDLLERMLVYEPSQRITARQALLHPYFQGVQLPDFNIQKQQVPQQVQQM